MGRAARRAASWSPRRRTRVAASGLSATSYPGTGADDLLDLLDLFRQRERPGLDRPSSRRGVARPGPGIEEVSGRREPPQLRGERAPGEGPGDGDGQARLGERPRGVLG